MRRFSEQNYRELDEGLKAGKKYEEIRFTPGPKKRRNDEYHLQSSVFTWWREHASDFGVDPRLYYSIQNGNLLGIGSERFIRAKMLRAAGMENGVSDSFMSIMRGGFGGCYIEFKTEVGVVSKAQKEMHALFASAGYQTWVCRALQTTQDVISNYLNL